MNDLISNSTHQFIDRYGKCRILQIDIPPSFIHSVFVVTPPIHPLDIPSISVTNIDNNYDDVIGWITSNNFNITSQYVSNSILNIISGLWISKDNNTFYIPLSKTPKKPKIPVTLDGYGNITLNDKFTIKDIEKDCGININCDDEKLSKFETFEKSKKITYFLKQYTLLEYSHILDKYDDIDKSQFVNFDWRDIFIIDKNYNYGLIQHNLKRRIQRYNKYLYKDNKIIVNSKKIVDGLIYFIKLQLKNSVSSTINYKDKYFLDDYYQSVNDYKNRFCEFIFLNRDMIFDWKKNNTELFNRSNIFSNIKPLFRSTYILVNHSLFNSNNPFMIQNLKIDTLKNSLIFLYEWNNNGVNNGYNYNCNDIYSDDEIDNIINTLNYTVFNISNNEEKDHYNDDNNDFFYYILYNNGSFTPVKHIYYE